MYIGQNYDQRTGGKMEIHSLKLYLLTKYSIEQVYTLYTCIILYSVYSLRQMYTIYIMIYIYTMYHYTIYPY